MSVFSALNRFISRLDSDGPQGSGGSGREDCGFQVLRNENHDIPLEPWFDFVVGINGRKIDNPDPNLFAQEVRNCAGSAVTLTIWSAKGQQIRDQPIPLPTPFPASLGLSLQWTPLTATASVWHILTIAPNSPADQAGLLPYSDWIVGSPEGVLRGESALGELVEDFLQRPLRLWVYNHEHGVARHLTVTPSRAWGGDGALGCTLGFGHLHRIPPPLEEPPAAPGETLFETARLSGEGYARPPPGSAPPPGGVGAQSPQRLAAKSPLQGEAGAYNPSSVLVPAAMAAPPPLAPPTGGPPRGGSAAGGRKGRKAGTHSPNAAFDEYFKESEAKSREVDHVPSRSKNASPLPPPPKKGGPPPPPAAASAASPAQPAQPAHPPGWNPDPLGLGEDGEGATTPSSLHPPSEERRQTRSPDPILDDDDE